MLGAILKGKGKQHEKLLNFNFLRLGEKYCLNTTFCPLMVIDVHPLPLLNVKITQVLFNHLLPLLILSIGLALYVDFHLLDILVFHADK